VSDDGGNSTATPIDPRRRAIRSVDAAPDLAAPERRFSEDGVDDMVELRLPAVSAYLSVLRTATAGLAARLDFTLDEIEDLRIAVDEACAMLIPDAAEGAELTCLFSLSPDALSVTVEVPSRTGRAPRRNTFAWTVLSALAGEVDAHTGPDGRVAVRLLKRRGGRP
jgi:serine/threonine-protein kinase RsbW